MISREEEERLRREARARGITREAMAALQPEGTTPRHPPVAPFVVMVSPALHTVLAALKLRAGSATYVFAGSRPMLRTLPEAARRRLIDTYSAPQFSWQTLRRTCGTYLTNAAGIFGAASAYRSARQLGHSVQVAETHYLGLVRGIPREARTLEAAMQIEELVANVVARAGTGNAASAPRAAGIRQLARRGK